MISPQHKDILLKAFPEGVIFLDLETTGLSPMVDKIIEIGAIKVKSKPEKFSQLINPKIIIPPNTIEIHQITNEMVKDAPTIDEVLPDFVNFIEDLPIFAHNAKFDLGFIVQSIHELDHYFPSNAVHDSIILSRTMIKDSDNHKLKTLCEYFDIALGNHHRAFDDALSCLKVVANCFHKKGKDFSRLQTRKVIEKTKIFDIGDYRRSNFEDLPQHLSGLIELVAKQAILEICYKGGTRKNAFRPVKALGLLQTPNGAQLNAICLISNQVKNFSINKVSDFKLHDHPEEFAKPSQNR